MKELRISLSKLQELVIDITKIDRNHTIPGLNRNENVVEHSFSVAMLCWKIHAYIKSNLNLEKIFKYCLAHDFLERGMKQDVNTYAPNKQKVSKKEYENHQLALLTNEFSDFEDMITTIIEYEDQTNEEARFVKIVDKMQAIILGEIDNWKPYIRVNVSHADFVKKGDEFMNICPDSLKDVLKELNEYSRSTFYDQPK
jgi:5'-deoxynucleotidase YfbR-like HD superfamily hydrolase